MALRRHHPPMAAPLEDEDLLGEILSRLPPLPSSIPRASAVSKLWGRVAAGPSFLRGFRAHHRKPPVLGVFEQYDGELVFTSVLDPPDRVPCERFSLPPGSDGDGDEFDALSDWSLLGCRHGRVLMISSSCSVLLVYAPVSGGRHRLAVPPDFGQDRHKINGAVLCAAGADQGHVHGDYHSSPFKVVLVGARSPEEPAFARLYSSETGMWADLVSTAEPCTGMVGGRVPCTLIGDSLYWWLYWSVDVILEFDLDGQRLAVVKRPPFPGIENQSGCIRIIRGENGGVGLAVLSYPCFQIWDRKVGSHVVASWVLQNTVNMREILGLPSGIRTCNEIIAGYSEDGDAVIIFVSRSFDNCAFMVQLGSMQFRKLQIGSLHSRRLSHILLPTSYHPFSTFYTAGTVRACSTAPAIEPPTHQSSGV